MYTRRGFSVVERMDMREDTEGPRMSRSPNPENRLSV